MQSLEKLSIIEYKYRYESAIASCIFGIFIGVIRTRSRQDDIPVQRKGMGHGGRAARELCSCDIADPGRVPVDRDPGWPRAFRWDSVRVV